MANDALELRTVALPIMSPSYSQTRNEAGASSSLLRLSPLDIRFTHDRISAHFRDGRALDDTINSLLSGALISDSLPPLEVVIKDGEIWSLSNRRLFVHRVVASLRKISTVLVRVNSLTSALASHLRYDDRFGRQASKWERAFSTSNRGVSVQVREPGSRHWQCHISPRL